MRVIKAAAVQLSPVLYGREGTVEKVVRKLHELGQQGVGLRAVQELLGHCDMKLTMRYAHLAPGAEHLLLYSS